MSDDRRDEGFLDRWSKRKQAVVEEQVEAEKADSAVETIDAEPETDEEALELLRQRDPELAEQVSSIEIDKLTYDDDFTVFMNDKVPEFIRRKALSKLWLSSPVLANIDGLNDYDDDFRDTGSLIEAVQTALNKDGQDEDEKASASGEPAADNDDSAVEEQTEIAEAPLDEISAEKLDDDQQSDEDGEPHEV